MKKNKIQYQMLIAVCLLIAALVLSTSRGAKIRKYTQSHMFFGAKVQVAVCYDKSQRETIKHSVDTVWKRWEEIDWRMNAAQEHSDVARINGSTRSAVRVEDDTYLVLSEAVRFNQLTSGAFDVGLRPLIQLWQEGVRKNEVPSEEAITRIRKNIGTRNIRLLKDSHVKVINKDTSISLEGIANGYATDEAARLLRKHGFDNFFIDAGSDVYVSGLDCDSERWKVPVKDPIDRTKIINVLQVSNAAISIQGLYQPFFEIKGKKFSHIIDPATGYPEEKVVSATVIAPSALEASAMAVSLCVMDAEKGRALIDQQGKGWASIAVVHDADHFTQYESKGFPLYWAPQNP